MNTASRGDAAKGGQGRGGAGKGGTNKGGAGRSGSARSGAAKSGRGRRGGGRTVTAPAAGGEFALPVTITPALPAVETFAELKLPTQVLETLRTV